METPGLSADSLRKLRRDINYELYLMLGNLCDIKVSCLVRVKQIHITMVITK